MKKTYGIRGSHVLQSWKIVNGLKEKKDFGYGAEYNYSYNVPKSLLYKDHADAPEAAVVVPNPKVHKKVSVGCPPGSRQSLFGHGCVVIF